MTTQRKSQRDLTPREQRRFVQAVQRLHGTQAAAPAYLPGVRGGAVASQLDIAALGYQYV